MKNFLLGITTLFLLSSCAPHTHLTHHTISYEVTPSHKDKKVQQYLDRQTFSYTVFFKEDSFEATAKLGNTSLRHYGFGADSALLIATFENGKYASTLGPGDIDKYLELRNNFEVKVLPGKETLDSLKCKKALLIYPDGNTGEVWVTRRFLPKNKHYEYGFPSLDGLPVKFDIREKDITYHFTLSNIEESPGTLKIPATGNIEKIPLDALLNKGISP